MFLGLLSVHVKLIINVEGTIHGLGQENMCMHTYIYTL